MAMKLRNKQIGSGTVTIIVALIALVGTIAQALSTYFSAARDPRELTDLPPVSDVGETVITRGTINNNDC